MPTPTPTPTPSTATTSLNRGQEELERSRHLAVEWFDAFVLHYSRQDVSYARVVPDVAGCLLGCARWIDAPNSDRPTEALARVLRSHELLSAVTRARHYSITGDHAVAEQLEIAYLAILRKACCLGVVEPGSVLTVLLGRDGYANPDAEAKSRVASFARHLASTDSLSHQEAHEFAGAVDAALRSGRWTERELGKRASVRRELLLRKGYGPRGQNNFYSSIALSHARRGADALLAACRQYDLLPEPAECYEKHSRTRARELAEALERSRAPKLSSGEKRAYGDQSSVWLAGLLDGLLSDESLASMRARYVAAEDACYERVEVTSRNLSAMGLR